MIKRILALLLVIALLAIVIITFICGITGSKYFMGMLFLSIVFPILLYAMALVARLLKRKGEELEKEVLQNEKAEDRADSKSE